MDQCLKFLPKNRIVKVVINIETEKQKFENFVELKLKSINNRTANSRYTRFGHLAKFKNDFVLGKFVLNRKTSHL